MLKRFIAIVIASITLPTIVCGQTAYRASLTFDGAKEKEQFRSHTSLESVEPNASVVYATAGVEAIITRMRMSKTSGSINDADRRETGRNSVLLADGGSNLLVEFCDINSHTPQADGISANGKGTLVTVNSGNINLSRVGSAGVNATNKSKIIVDKTTINSYSNQSPAFYACNDGELEVTEAKGDISGLASPLFYASTGSIKANKCRMSSARWSIGCVDGGELELDGNQLKSGSISGFLVYGADGIQKSPRSEGKLTLKKNNLTVNEGPLILVTNAKGYISLSGNKISCKNDEIIAVKADEWGTEGENFGDASISVEKQTLNGDILVDGISSLNLELKKGAKLNGNITGESSPRRDVKVVIKKGAQWSFKGVCYLDAITFEQPLEKGLKQIKGKHVIYYDPDNEYCSVLGGKEYKTKGGVLRPIKK